MREPTWFGRIASGVAFVFVGVLCMGLGWFLFRGPASSSTVSSGGKPATARGAPTRPTAAATIRATESAPPPPPKPTKPESPPPPVAVLRFEKDVLPILEKKCISCHGELKKSGKLDVRTLIALKQGGSGGPSVIAGEPDKSPLWDEVAGDRMPPASKPKLTPEEKATLRNWILGGAN
jgi:hypothetical protein